MLITILSIIVNIVYVVVLNLELYTDRAMMPTGEVFFFYSESATASFRKFS